MTIDALKYHRGRFRISGQILDNAIGGDGNAASLMAVFARMIPINIQFDYMRNELVVEGYSPDFDALSEGQSVKEYDAVCNSETGKAWFAGRELSSGRAGE